MSKKVLVYLGFFVVLMVGFYFALTAFIPGFGEVKLPVIKKVQPFTFINQDGKLVKNSDLEGNVYVAEYFFTTCPGICKQMNANMKHVYGKLKDQPDFKIVSLTCDPATDSSAQLKQYANKLDVDTNKWIFLTGNKKELYQSARLSFMIDDPQNNVVNIEDDFLHTQNWALVDKKGEVRKVYDGLNKDEINEMIADAKKLLKEK